KLEVVQEERRLSELALIDTKDERVLVFLRSRICNQQVKQALERALKLRGQLAETQHDIVRVEQTLQVIDKDQARMRANMERVPQTSEAYKRYLKKFDEQETEIEKRRAEIAKLQESAERQRKEYESFLVNLSVE